MAVALQFRSSYLTLYLLAKMPVRATEIRLLHGGSLNDLWLINLFKSSYHPFNSF